ncbi:cell death abnormality protein 1 [Biomphalaria pfeifferi]|uniref:Cell death abnormality protein 1 n=1 Tax=Biomphalaria pfeifferi TaxID=112525 RepID=A0AAD8FIQ4_BIOPF|nr:cell death abnormality protein 1 [Biomphalaria pfeifferi]
MSCIKVFIFAVFWELFLHSLDACDKGWFGERCQFKCHCQSDCDKEGQCAGDEPRCDSWWFGTKCQFQDLATVNGTTITTNARQNTHWLTDRDAQTCNNDPNLESVLFVWNMEYWFTWMRIGMKSLAQFQSVDVQFNQNTSSKVLNCTKFTLNRSSPTLEIHCSLDFPVRQINIKAAADLCDIYISGGVDFALKQMADQSSNYGGTEIASLAVDGNLNTWSHTEHEDRPYLFVTLPKPRLVTRIVLYNRMYDGYNILIGHRLRNFELKALDENGDSQFRYKDKNSEPLHNYTVVIAGKKIIKIIVYATYSYFYEKPVLALRELQIFGECLPGTWGLYCNKSCPSYCQVTCTQEEGSCDLVHEVISYVEGRTFRTYHISAPVKTESQ